MFEVWLQMSDTNIDRENPSDLPALVAGAQGEVWPHRKIRSPWFHISRFHIANL